MYYLLKWIKFSIKKQNIKKILETWGKIVEKSGNFVSPEKWEPWKVHLSSKLALCESTLKYR